MNIKTALCALLLSGIALTAAAQKSSESELFAMETDAPTNTSLAHYGSAALLSEADSVIKRDTIITLGKKKTPRYKIRRIDRGIRDQVFIPKGTWMVGGTVSYSEYNEDNYNLLVLKDVTGEGYTFKLNPYGAYFFRNNMAIGLRLGYNRSYLDVDNFNLDLGDDLNITLTDLYYIQQKYEVGCFLRTIMPIGNSKIFGLFNDVRINYAYTRTKDSTGSDTEYDGTFAITHSLEIGMAPGLTAFITNWAAVEVSLNLMGFKFKWQDQDTNQVESGSYNTSSGNFKINLFSINIGMTFYL